MFQFRRSSASEQTGDAFVAAFGADTDTSAASSDWADGNTHKVFGASSPRYSTFLGTEARASYDNGLWRLLLPGGSPELSEFNGPTGWTSDWPEMVGLTAFGYDWLGRLYVVDRAGAWTKQGAVVRFSPATGDVEEATAKPSSLDEYLFELLPRHKRDWLSADYFDDWREGRGRPLKTTECVGYTVPLLLGGVDDVPNLEIIDLMVHLSASGQIFRQAMDLDDDTTINRVKFET